VIPFLTVPWSAFLWLCACICIIPAEAFGLTIQRLNTHSPFQRTALQKSPTFFLALSYAPSLSPLLYWLTKSRALHCEDWCWTFSPLKHVSGLDNIVPKELLGTLPSLFKCVSCGRHSLSRNWPLFWLYSQTYQSKTQPKLSNYCISFLILSILLSLHFLSV